VRALAAGVDGLLAVRRSLSPLSDWTWGRRLLLATAVADAGAVPPTQARLLVGASAGARRTPDALATITSADLSPALKRLPMPVGLIWGAKDRTVPARLARKIVELRPDCQLEIIEDAGHVSMVERPQAFVRALLGLLSRLPHG
jgi:pimeloyl-ACP methyl ester carboxylesterase